jgi:tetratricopeptide (TPR) repeat protein
MTRDNIVFATSGFLLGLILGGMVIGPKLARSRLSGAGPPPQEAAAAGQAPAASPAGNNTMMMVRQQIDSLKATLDRDPNNLAALVQLGNLYMDAQKFSDAAGYYERALKVEENPSVRTDLGICYKNIGRKDEAAAAFEQAWRNHPDQWQALFNHIVLLAESRRFGEARALMDRLKQIRPGDADVQRLEQALNAAK